MLIWFQIQVVGIGYACRSTYKVQILYSVNCSYGIGFFTHSCVQVIDNVVDQDSGICLLDTQATKP